MKDVPQQTRPVAYWNIVYTATNSL